MSRTAFKTTLASGTLIVMLALGIAAIAPIVAHAQTAPAPATQTVEPKSSGSTVKLDDPLKTGGDIRVVFARIIQLMTGISGSLALAAFVWGGFQMLIADGDSSKIEQGKNTLKYATYGLIMIFGAYVALRAVYGVLGV